MRLISALVSAGFVVLIGPAAAGDLVSTNYTLRAANLNSGSAGALSSTAPVPRFSSSGVSLGQSTAICWPLSKTTTTTTPGPFEIRRGGAGKAVVATPSELFADPI